MFEDLNLKMTVWPIEKETGYKPVTTFWNDFEVAEQLEGAKGVIDTYKRGFENWKWNTEFVTELTMVLNWRLFYWFEMRNMELAKLYEKLYFECDGWCLKNLKGDDLKYYIRTTD